MDKSVLLVLLCLQVFLLITAFTSTDAAALALTDPQPPDLVEKRNDRKREIFENRRKRYVDCGWKPECWGVAGETGPPGPPLSPPPPPPPRRPEVLVG